MRIFAPLISAVAALALFVVGVSACNSVPDTNRRQFNILSPGKEASLGFSEFEKMKKSKQISRNSAYNTQVQRVGAQLARVMPVEGAQWEFVVFEDETPNAFALPGGKVGVHTGLFQVTQSDAGLAAVIGHEVGHVVARHSGERMTQGVVSAAAVAGATALMNQNSSDGSAAPGITAGVLGGAALVYNRKFSRNQELEADKLGALYMARAGYDPRESVSLWQRFSAYKTANGASQKGSILSTHPVDSVRIEQLQAYMPRALQEFQGN